MRPVPMSRTRVGTSILRAMTVGPCPRGATAVTRLRSLRGPPQWTQSLRGGSGARPEGWIRPLPEERAAIRQTAVDVRPHRVEPLGRRALGRRPVTRLGAFGATVFLLAIVPLGFGAAFPATLIRARRPGYKDKTRTVGLWARREGAAFRGPLRIGRIIRSSLGRCERARCRSPQPRPWRIEATRRRRSA